MITILRKHHKWLMIVIAILAIPFVFYFNKTDFNTPQVGNLGRIYDRPVTRLEFQRSARLFNLARDLGMFTLLQDLSMGATTEAEAYSEFTWNRLILHHEAEQLGIRPSPGEIADVVKTLRPFLGASGFDINKYNEFAQNALPSLGFTEAHIEELVSDQLSLNRIKDLLGAGVQVAESESRENYEQTYGKLSVAVVRLRSDNFAGEVKITDEDVAKYYEAHKAQLNSDEKRRLEFVTFALSDEQKKLVGKERVDVLQKLADRANDFTQALLEKNADFGALAAKFQVPVNATEEFAVTAPDPKLAADAQLAQYAFQLTAREPFSDAIQAKDAFYVLHLLGVAEARPLSLDEAKPRIVDALKKERLQEMLTNKGSEVVRVLREGVKAGAPLEKAIEKTGQKIERIPPFSLADDPVVKAEKDKEPKPETPDLPFIKNAISEIGPGEVTEFTPSDKGGFVAVVEKRDAIDPATYQQSKELFNSRYLRGKRSVVFYEWLRDRRAAAHMEVAKT